MSFSFNVMIGRLDRLLSEFLIEAKGPHDQADWQTLKHHAEDLIGVGTKALELFNERGSPVRPKADRTRSKAKGKRPARR